MVRLDGHARPPSERYRFNHIRIERALGQKVRAAHRLGFGVKNINEQAANDFAFLFRVRNACQFSQKQIGHILMNKVDFIMIPKHVDNLFTLIQPHQTMVHKDTGQLIANGFMEQNGDH